MTVPKRRNDVTRRQWTVKLLSIRNIQCHFRFLVHSFNVINLTSAKWHKELTTFYMLFILSLILSLDAHSFQTLKIFPFGRACLGEHSMSVLCRACAQPKLFSAQINVNVTWHFRQSRFIKRKWKRNKKANEWAIERNWMCLHMPREKQRCCRFKTSSPQWHRMQISKLPWLSTTCRGDEKKCFMSTFSHIFIYWKGTRNYFSNLLISNIEKNRWQPHR